ncbi:MULTISPECIES: hypothetical protein [unclassified Synechocystis]|uniref:hypothetical protein n=1 Tax=unclassified Synechocystis TaxID=2640012 RepID=UPI00048AB34C|nr:MULTISPECIES: hypothetical protein [unclassified Synechocystis]MCT0253285.1 hypothetical protein [Synechocystis sp. CS-94]
MKITLFGYEIISIENQPKSDNKNYESTDDDQEKIFKNRRTDNLFRESQDSEIQISSVSQPQKIVNPKTLILAIYPDKNLNLFQQLTVPLARSVCEKLYESTQYLRIDNNLFFKSKSNKIQDFKVQKGEECDDDIHLIRIYLNDNDERFNQRVNQVDRIRAFRELPNLVDDIQVSPRLRIEAGNLFNLYHR